MDRGQTSTLLVVGACDALERLIEEHCASPRFGYQTLFHDRLSAVADDDLERRCAAVLLGCRNLSPEELRSFRAACGLPVILVADSDCREQLHEALELGAGPWLVDLTSPLSRELLPTLVRHVTARPTRQSHLDEDAVGREQERYRELVETLPHGIAEVDRDGRFTFVNTAYLRLRGLEPSDIIGRLAWETSPLPEEADRLRQFYRHVSTYQPEPKPYFTRTLNRDNKTIELRIDWSYRRASGRELTGFIACVTDVTEQQRAERDARQRLSDLAHVGRLSVVGEMLSGLAHEIRQPLSAIVNEGQACRHLLDGPREVVRESLDQIVNQAVRATQIVRSLRDFTRRGEAKRQAEDLGRLLRDVLRLLEFDASSFSVKLRLDVSDDLPPVWVDAMQIEQVVVNLVRNAMEAIEEARSAERIVTIRARHSGEDVVVEVEDTGPGLSEEVAARLFESYFTTKMEGMGLGLPISRTIIEDHGGGLEAVTGKTPGAVFRFTLPLA